MKGEPLNELPGWPAALNKKLAAAYCGLSPETFDAVCPIKPISFTGSTRGDRYLRARIDEWLFSIDPNAPVTEKRRFGDKIQERQSLAERLYGTKRENKVDEILNRRGEKPAPPPMEPTMNWREEAVMTALFKLAESERRGWQEIPSFGPDTQQRLLKRGFVEREADDFWLSAAGRRAWKAYTKNRGFYF